MLSVIIQVGLESQLSTSRHFVHRQLRASWDHSQLFIILKRLHVVIKKIDPLYKCNTDFARLLADTLTRNNFVYLYFLLFTQDHFLLSTQKPFFLNS